MGPGLCHRLVGDPDLQGALGRGLVADLGAAVGVHPLVDAGVAPLGFRGFLGRRGEFPGLDLEAAEDVPISSFAHKRDYKAVTVSTSMDQLIEAAMNQNFVPVVDDRGKFIGIVRRQAIIRYCYDKTRAEQSAAKPARRREMASAAAN